MTKRFERNLDVDRAQPDIMPPKVIAVIVAGSLALSALGVWFIDATKPPRPSEKTQNRELTAQARVDGFGVSNISLFDNDALVNLNLGNCTLSDVEVKFHRDPKGNIIDTGPYQFSALAFAHKIENPVLTPVLHYETDTEGQPVTFSFGSLTELKDHILGPEPCQTLASTTIRP